MNPLKPSSHYTYKHPAIISGANAGILSKTNFGPTCHHHPREVVPFCMYAWLSLLLPFLNKSWKSCSVRVFSTICNSASITSNVWKWQPSFQFYFQSGKQRTVGWMAEDSHVVFDKKFPGEKGHETVCSRDATTLLPNSRSLHTFSHRPP
jgi:hypothetical protein